MSIMELCTTIEEFAEMLESDKDFAQSAEVKRIFKNLSEEFADIRQGAKEIYEIFEKSLDKRLKI